MRVGNYAVKIAAEREDPDPIEAAADLTDETAVHADAAPRPSEPYFRAVCESSPVGIFLADEEGHCVYLNPSAEVICGLPLKQARGRGWMNALHPEDRERVKARWGRAVQDSSQYASPIHRFTHKNGDPGSTPCA